MRHAYLRTRLAKRSGAAWLSQQPTTTRTRQDGDLGWKTEDGLVSVTFLLPRITQRLGLQQVCPAPVSCVLFRKAGPDSTDHTAQVGVTGQCDKRCFGNPIFVPQWPLSAPSIHNQYLSVTCSASTCQDAFSGPVILSAVLDAYAVLTRTRTITARLASKAIVPHNATTSAVHYGPSVLPADQTRPAFMGPATCVCVPTTSH